MGKDHNKANGTNTVNTLDKPDFYEQPDRNIKRNKHRDNIILGVLCNY